MIKKFIQDLKDVKKIIYSDNILIVITIIFLSIQTLQLIIFLTDYFFNIFQ
jgi:hypothetical protein